MSGNIHRAWINQPSTLQPHHDLHGTVVLCHPEAGTTWRVYFFTGDIHSMQMSRNALSMLFPR